MNELNELHPFELIDKFVSMYKMENNGIPKDISNLYPKSIYSAYNMYGRAMINYSMKTCELMQDKYQNIKDDD